MPQLPAHAWALAVTAFEGAPGRRMSASLEAALDNLTDRAAVIGALSTSTSPRLGALHRAVAIELAMCELREQDTLRRLATTGLLGDVVPPSGADDAPYWPAVPGDA